MFTPLKDRVLMVESDRVAEVAEESRIVIPDTAVELPTEGKVIAIGSEVTEVSIDDYVMFGKYGVMQVPVSGEEYLMIKEEDILCIVEGA